MTGIEVSVEGWALQDIVLLGGFCARINHLFTAPPLPPSALPTLLLSIARVLCNIRPPSDPPRVCYSSTPYNIGHGNIL